MKKGLLIGLTVVFVLALLAVGFAEIKGGRIDLKVGDEVYVCGCGEGCPCYTISRNPGKCTCDKDLVKTKVNKVEGDKAFVEVKGKEIGFPMVGKYACPCGPGCKCDTISQNPGKCACGKELKKVE